jgi:peroxiredoxin
MFQFLSERSLVLTLPSFKPISMRNPPTVNAAKGEQIMSGLMLPSFNISKMNPLTLNAAKGEQILFELVPDVLVPVCEDSVNDRLYTGMYNTLSSSHDRTAAYSLCDWKDQCFLKLRIF